MDRGGREKGREEWMGEGERDRGEMGDQGRVMDRRRDEWRVKEGEEEGRGREGGRERRGEGRSFQHCSPDSQGEALSNDHFAYRFEVANSITCNSVM